MDETLFRTSAKVKVIKGSEVVRELSNREFNAYRLGEGERFDFSQFKDTRLFKDTSEPVVKVVERVKRMILRIKETSSRSRIIILTARKDMDDKQSFLEAFREQGIDVDRKDIIYIERAGNLEGGSVAERKLRVMRKYLSTGSYQRCRLIDDDEQNLEAFKSLLREFPGVVFYGLLVQPDGSLRRVL